jgi:hypothetical protein
MTMLTLSEIKEKVDCLAKKVSVSGYYLPTYGHSEDGARPHIEVDACGYHYVVVERGQELKRFITSDLNELLYQIFEAITFSLACDYELKHRIENQDSRRIMFQHQIKLLSQLSKEWSVREIQQHQQILCEHPFDDLASTRAKFSAQVGWKAACEKYPLPK